MELAFIFRTYTYAILAGFILDFFLGDPPSFPHPVRFIGKLISVLDQKLRHGENDERDIKSGALATFITVFLSTAIPLVFLLLIRTYLPYAYTFFCALICWQMISARQLMREAQKVEKALYLGLVEDARATVSMIVGRDTDELDEAGIAKAAVETVASTASIAFCKDILNILSTCPRNANLSRGEIVLLRTTSHITDNANGVFKSSNINPLNREIASFKTSGLVESSVFAAALQSRIFAINVSYEFFAVSSAS